jgi:serine/threonine protein kinase
MVGRTVLQYQLGEKLGSGGMGEVYKATDTRLNRLVAIKVLTAGISADPEYRRRFIQEGQAASALNHPNIITIYDVVHDGDTQYMVMEYVAGKTLLELIPANGLRVPEAIHYATQMADALSAAHTAGIVHRDLKPANVMVNSRGLVKLLDFGLAKLMHWSDGEQAGNTATVMHNPLTVGGAIMGTVSYMSPEQAGGGKLDARSDIFSFGAVLYEMVTGRCAFRGTSAISTLSAVLRDDAQPMTELTAGVPSELEQIVAGCLKKDPAQRIQSIQQVSVALAALKRQSNSATLYSPPTVRTLVPPPSSRRSASKALIVSAALFVLLAAAVGGVYWWSTGHRSAPSPAGTQPRASAAAPPSPDATLTNDNVIEMIGAKVTPSLIVSQIRASKTNFNLSASEVIRLTRAGVPADVIEVMRHSGIGPSTTSATPVILADGLPIRLTLAEDIPSDATQGDAVSFRVARDLRVDGAIVISEGTVATGFIVDGAKRKILGFGGKMTFRLERVDAVDGRKMNIRATPNFGRGGSKKPLNTGARKSKEVAATVGAAYLGYIDGAQTVLVKK